MNHIDRLRDAKLLVDAMRRTRQGTQRHDFLLRMQRSFREWGSLTPAMRESLRPRAGLLTGFSS
jgi:hypothetical protein